MQNMEEMWILIAPLGCLRKQTRFFGSSSLMIFFFALDVYMTRRTFVWTQERMIIFNDKIWLYSML